LLTKPGFCSQEPGALKSAANELADAFRSPDVAALHSTLSSAGIFDELANLQALR
jgi:hypothetical protein